MSAFPVSDGALWVRWLLSAALCLWLPGHLLAGRWVRGLDGISRGVLSIGVGLLLVPLLGLLFAAVGIALTPWTYLPAVVGLSLLLGRSRGHRDAVTIWTQHLPALDARARAIAAGSILFSALLLGLGFHDFVVPPHVHDASNHAYLTLRSVESSSLDPRELFAGAEGRPAVLYLAGWHAAAGLISRVSGVAPYISTWMLALSALILLPLSLTLLWRAWRLPMLVVALAMPLVVSNQLVPGGVLGWGGFGQILGFFLVPPLMLLLRAVLLRPGLWTGSALGLALGSLVQVHASEVAVVLLLAWPTHATLPRERRRMRWRDFVQAWIAVLAMAAIATGWLVWDLGRDYAASTTRVGPVPALELGDALKRWAAAGGKVIAAQVLAALGLVLALRRRSTRAVGSVALALGVFYVALAVWHGSLTLMLATPFYQQASRVLYLQMFVLPPLMVLPLLELLRTRPAIPGAGWIAGVLVLGTVAWASPGVVTNFRNMGVNAPFSAEAHWFAAEASKWIGDGDLVANLWQDGSTWAMHVSGRRFLLPCSWELFDAEGSLRPRVRGLLDDPWPPSTLELQSAGVTHLWLSDTVSPDAELPSRPRSQLEQDPRFEVLLQGEEVALYRIRWMSDAD